jgi:hypothetical protein
LSAPVTLDVPVVDWRPGTHRRCPGGVTRSFVEKRKINKEGQREEKRCVRIQGSKTGFSSVGCCEPIRGHGRGRAAGVQGRSGDGGKAGVAMGGAAGVAMGRAAGVVRESVVGAATGQPRRMT